jgi:tight adherence protein B
MNASTFWLGRLGVAALALTLATVVVALFGAEEAAGSKALRLYVAALDRKLRFVRLPAVAERVVAGQVALSVLAIAVAVATQLWLALVAVPLAALLPRVLLDRRASDRITKVEAQIEPWLVAIANALKASPSLGEAIASSVSVVPAPMSQEVETIVKEYELGTPLDRALDNFSERIPSRTLQGTVLALKVARKSGGDFSTMLENAAAALRELARLEGVVRTKTAEGKAQAFVIGLVPVPMVLGIHSMDPKFFVPLGETFTGHLIVGAAGLLWLMAVLLARKILAVDV